MVNSVSEKGLQFVAQREAAVLKPYMDGNKLAIGFGDNDPALKGTDRITLDEAVERYVKKSNEYVASLNRLFPFEMEQHHFDALFSLAYNYGAGGLVKKTGLVSLVDRYYKTGRSPDTLKAIGEKIAVTADEQQTPPQGSRDVHERRLRRSVEPAGVGQRAASKSKVCADADVPGRQVMAWRVAEVSAEAPGAGQRGCTEARQGRRRHDRRRGARLALLRSQSMGEGRQDGRGHRTRHHARPGARR